MLKNSRVKISPDLAIHTLITYMLHTWLTERMLCANTFYEKPLKFSPVFLHVCLQKGRMDASRRQMCYMTAPSLTLWFQLLSQQFSGDILFYSAPKSKESSFITCNRFVQLRNGFLLEDGHSPSAAVFSVNSMQSHLRFHFQTVPW